MWADIDGYRYPYRVSDQGEVQKWDGARWLTLSQDASGVRVQVRLMKKDGTPQKVGVLRLLDRHFNGGYADRHGLCVGPKNGVKTDCTLKNIAYRTQSEIGRKSMARTMRRPVIRYDRHGGVIIYKSVKEAARKNGMSPSALDSRLYRGVLDPNGYRFEVAK